MKFSFIVPAYNEQAAIATCIDSIQKEIRNSNANAEIIVVNNASTDHTREIAASYPGVLVIDESKRGTNRARQTGFLASSGDIIANIDADCEMTPKWIDTATKEFEKDPGLVCLTGPVFYDLSALARNASWVFQIIGFMIYLFNRIVFNIGSGITGGNSAIRREALEKIGGYDTRFTFWGDDTDTGKRLHAVGKVKWNIHLPIYSSGRRFVRDGFVRTATKYVVSNCSRMYQKHPATSE